jgi:Tol biopolymer transport system component
MRPDGRGARLLRSDSHSSDQEPAWSHDGGRIAFVARQGSRSTIEVMRADGTHAHALTDSRFDAWNPVWLPHDSGIAFIGSHVGYEAGNLFVMRSDGRSVHQITHWKGRARIPQFTWIGAPMRTGHC